VEVDPRCCDECAANEQCQRGLAAHGPADEPDGRQRAAWFEEPVNADRVKEILRSRLVEPFPRFRQLVIEPRVGVGISLLAG
jgi:hypothetical protein